MSERPTDAEGEGPPTGPEAEAGGPGGEVPARPEGRSRAVAVRGGSEVALAELISRVVERGVVITGDLVVSVAGVDLLYLGLDVLLSATDRLEAREEPGEEGGAGSEGSAGSDDGSGAEDGRASAADG